LHLSLACWSQGAQFVLAGSSALGSNVLVQAYDAMLRDAL
jgi:hypothetical protein